MSFKVKPIDVDVILIEAPDKLPKKLVKGQPVASIEGLNTLDREIFDRESVEVQEKPGGGLIVKAWKTAENLKALEFWQQIFDFPEISLKSKELEELQRLCLELRHTCLGRMLNDAIRVEWVFTPEDVAESIIAEQELEADWRIIEKFLHYDETKHRFVWNPPIHLLKPGETFTETKPETQYYCPQCSLIFSSRDLEYTICPKCYEPLQEIATIHLWKISSEHVGKRGRCRAVIVGEGPAKAVYPEWTAECGKCEVKVELNLPSPELKQSFFELLVTKGSFSTSDVQNILLHASDLPKCVHGNHFWSLKPKEPALNYREVYLRDDVAFEEMMDKSLISRNYPAILLGETPETQKIDVTGTVIINPKSNVLSLVVDSFEEASPVRPIALTQEDQELLRKHFKDRTLEELLILSEENICPSIVGRPEPKLASLITVNTPLWVSIDGKTPVPCTPRTLFVGDKRCGKGSIIRWYSEVGGVGEHGVGETSSRAGLSYFVEPETNTIIWGLLPQADRALALVEALHGLPSEQMIEFREVLASQKVEVRKKVSGCRWARARILADANPPQSMDKYVYPAMAIPSLRCFYDSVDITRWDLFVPFFSLDVPEEEVVRARTAQGDPMFIEALQKLVMWCWNLKMSQIKITDEAQKRLEDATINMLQSYRTEEIPLIHNASKWQMLRLACGFAVVTLSTADFESLTVETKHVDLAENFMKHLLDMWKLRECRGYLKAEPLTEEKWREVQAYLAEKDVAPKILEALAFKPLDGLAVAGKVGYAYSYARKVLAEMRQMNLIDRIPQGYILTTLGAEVCRRIKAPPSGEIARPSILTKENVDLCLSFITNPVNDLDGDGWIQIEDWVKFAKARGITEPEKIVESLEKEGKVFFNFERTGVKAI